LRYDREAQELISEEAGLAYPIRDGIPSCRSCWSTKRDIYATTRCRPSPRRPLEEAWVNAGGTLMPRREPEVIDVAAIKTDLDFLIERVERLRKGASPTTALRDARLCRHRYRLDRAF
jgi:hypothetical protein